MSALERERRRVALQSTAEMWRGLDILDRALRQGKFTVAREITAMLVANVVLVDAALVEYLRDHPIVGAA